MEVFYVRLSGRLVTIIVNGVRLVLDSNVWVRIRLTC